MNKRSILGMVVVGLIFVGFTIYNSRQQKKYEAQVALQVADTLRPDADQVVQQKADSLVAARVEPAEAADTTATADTLQVERFTVGNDVMSVDFTTRGAQIEGVTLNKFGKYAPRGVERERVRLFDPAASTFALKLVQGTTADRVFALKSREVESDGTTRVVMVSGETEFEYVIYNSGMPERDYLIDFRVRGAKATEITWTQRTYQNEKGFQNENTYTTAAWHTPKEPSIEDVGVSTGEKTKSAEGAADWVGFKQQFFTSALIAPVAGARMSYKTEEEGSGFMKDFTAELTLKPADEQRMAFYFGPNRYGILKKISLEENDELHMERLVPLGWGIFGWVNRWFVIPIFDWLQNWGLGFGLIILILSILVRVVILPLTYKSYISTAKMRVIKPEVEQITKKYPKKEDAMKRQQATMELYKKAGINPMGGCIPLLIQMPIIIAMFRFFPASIELRGQSFLWADDLSAYDSVLQLPFKIPFYGDHVSLFALLMTVALFLFSKINYAQTAQSQPQMAGMKFMMVYLMPVMMLLWFNSYASGLTYYYFLANILTIIQTMIIRRSVNDEKIHAIMRASSAKAKTKKKSKFQLRYEEMLKQQQNRK